MESEPLYIPRKFRSDRYHVMSEAEITIINTRDFKRFKSVCEILRIRRDEFEQRMSQIDKEVCNCIKSSYPIRGSETMAFKKDGTNVLVKTFGE